MFKKIDPKLTFPKMEEEILKFWNENKIFEKSLEIRQNAPHYSFYDGPPFATGDPHYGHIVGSTMKDVVPRYWTMRGYYVERKWGWDCHGLPIENIVEKEMGSQTKKDIEAIGVEKFNELCRTKVLTYVEVWKKVINRLGRWADMENSYKTMDLSYMESVWWVFKQLWEKDLIYEGYRSMHVCPRCETTLSQSEVSEGYTDIKDLSAIAKFELVDQPGVFVLAWTTTPWTLIGNVALAVNSEIEYVMVETVNLSQENDIQDETYILAKSRLYEVMKDRKYEIVKEFKGENLVGKAYKPLFDFYASQENLENRGNGWKVYAGDFVTTEDGTGVVHIAPAFGEDDMKLGAKYSLPFVQHVGMDGVIKPEAGEFAGLNVKPASKEKDGHMTTDIEIIKYLAKNGLLFAKEKYEHSYPHCWRCDTPLMNYATSSWFVSVTKIKEQALELAKEINWSPANMKEGRFGNWLAGARDWSISRQRFWASVIPIWKCSCGEMKVFGSVAELEQVSGQKITDIHKHIVDKITFPCEKCGQNMQRVSDVLDTWFDSGSMPYAQGHYPFENKEKFEQSFPADFIAEGVDQTRAWFYYQHVIASGIKHSNAFKNVIVNGIVLAEDGKKMSKRLKNYPDPTEMLDKYGADTLRYYLMSSPVVAAQNLNFSEGELAEIVRGMMRMLWNSYSFFVLYANVDKWEPKDDQKQELGENFLDYWILSELNTLINDVNEAMEKYELNKAARYFPKFVDNLSNWYIRRSRKRFWKSENDNDKEDAYATLYHVLVTFAKVIAPFMPFVADEIFRNLTGRESVHLERFPVSDEKYVSARLNEQMKALRDVISEGLQLRAQAKIKVRQPLASVKIKNQLLTEEMLEIIKEELNVKEVLIDAQIENEITLDTQITEELKQEGLAREIIRYIQEMRKTASYEVDNRIKVSYQGGDEIFEKLGEMISKEVLADALEAGEMEDADLVKEFNLEGEMLKLQIKR
jgi:isoleucyl-tRNA synthetase